ncbi:MAG: SPOR domain-containing protein [Candidatus Electryoneaceae bacterium]|nr:SPOR domain-containing protein [Candidatus Electryoneaceae bacterium]
MVEIIKYKLIVFVAVLLFIACAADRPSWREDEAFVEEQIGTDVDTSDASGSYAPIQTERLQPLKPKIPGFYVSPSKLDTKPRILKPLRPSSGTISSIGEIYSGTMQTVSGYRVQVVAASDQSSARLIEENIRQQFGDIVYLIYEAPRYKVRVGNFTVRDEATLFRQQLMQAGYRDAWVVPSQVNVRR